MFKPGDYVTGIDRSYKRSIYQVINLVDGETFKLQFVCLDGALGTKHDTCERPIKQFRYATSEEVFRDLGLALGYNLIGFVRSLIKKSYRARRRSG